MEEEDTYNAANSELRFIALELMKIAQKSGKSFDEVAEEFLSNTLRLQQLIARGVYKSRKKLQSKAAASKRK
ncbi:MAG: hypothetical protein QW275_03025 [Candidatus Anstonellaceae archaeon]